MRTTAPVWVCEYKDCGHVWLCGDKTQPPTQCGKCRRRHWHKASAVVTTSPVQPKSKLRVSRQPKTHAMRPGEKRTYCYISNPTGGEFDKSGNRFFPREGEQPTCKVCLKSMAARAGKSVTASPSPVSAVDVDSDSTKDGLCDVWWHEKNDAGDSVKVCCPRVATKRLYDDQSYVGSTCDKEEVKVGDDWMGFTISRIELIETPVTTSQPNLCELCETNPRSDKRKNGNCDECQARLEKYAKRSDAGRKAWKSRNQKR